MHDASPTTEGRPDTGSLAAGLVLGLLGATALAALVLAGGHGVFAALLAYSLGGAAGLLAATLGRAALAPLRGARVRRPAPASTFA
jgi:hypothetical protein